MAMAWYAAGAPHGVKTYNQIVEKFGLGASRDFLKEADPFHDAESDEEYWTRVEGAFRLIADNPNLKDGDDVLQISHGNTLLSLGHRFGGPDLDLNERPAKWSGSPLIDFDTDKPFGEADDHRFVRQVANSKQYISNSTYECPRRTHANESVSRTALRRTSRIRPRARFSPCACNGMPREK